MGDQWKTQLVLKGVQSIGKECGSGAIGVDTPTIGAIALPAIRGTFRIPPAIQLHIPQWNALVLEGIGDG
jgi:hypothetical protein